ncbi:MAG: hypothetical protein ACRELB_21545, partial [Polyangiaceae bacterium]
LEDVDLARLAEPPPARIGKDVAPAPVRDGRTRGPVVRELGPAERAGEEEVRLGGPRRISEAALPARPFARLAVLAALATLVTLAAPRSAAAQVRWDAWLQAGAAQRLTSGAPAGAPSPGLGPRLELQAHLALLPMIRVGMYAAEDL